MTRPRPVKASMAGPEPGVVRIRLLGAARDAAAVAGALVTVLPTLGVELIEESLAYANRREAGERRYLIVRVSQGGQQ